MPLTVAIGSTNPVKVAAVRNAILPIWPDAQFMTLNVESGVGAMPMSDEAGAQGALQRARLALESVKSDIGVGLEGAVSDSPTGMYMTNWVAIAHRDGRSSCTCGARLLLPERIARELRGGAELGPVMDRITGHHNTKQHLGAAGYLTCGLVPRELNFQITVALALAPFLHPELYGESDRKVEKPS